MTFRAVDCLRSADLVACEDTRRSGKLLKEFSISTRLVSFHEHNEEARLKEIVSVLAVGGSVAVISDAGTPGIADPGFRAVRAALDAGAEVIPVPGPAAFVAALTASGLPTDAVFFAGFLPSKKNERIRKLEEIRDVPATIVLYEAPHRIRQSLADCLEVLGDRKAVLARELTKLHEEFLRGTVSEISAMVESSPPKGEIVLLFDRVSEIEIRSADADSASGRYSELISEGVEPRKALKQVAKELGLPRSEAYRKIHAFGDPQ